MDISRTFDLKQALSPIWSGGMMYHESVMYLENETHARLLYTPAEVFAVRSYDYKTEYVRGMDWELDGDMLIRLPGSRIPAISLNDYYPPDPEKINGECFGCTMPEHAYIRYGEWDAFQQYQIVISYRHNEVWPDEIPPCRKEQFANVFEKLSRGEEATVVFYGDSITTGANCTMLYDHAPYTPSFPYMVTCAIAEKYGYKVSLEADPYLKPTETPLSGARVLHYINTAVGGMDSIWGLENASERVCTHQPDLLVLAFGMNDGGKTAEEFVSITADTVANIRKELPEVEICLIATMLPHWRVSGFFRHQIEFEPVLMKYAKTQSRLAVVPMTSVHKVLLKKKEYYSMTGNNVNHPNDFMGRVYAMAVLQTLGA